MFLGFSNTHTASFFFFNFSTLYLTPFSWQSLQAMFLGFSNTHTASFLSLLALSRQFLVINLFLSQLGLECFSFKLSSLVISMVIVSQAAQSPFLYLQISSV